MFTFKYCPKCKKRNHRANEHCVRCGDQLTTAEQFGKDVFALALSLVIIFSAAGVFAGRSYVNNRNSSPTSNIPRDVITEEVNPSEQTVTDQQVPKITPQSLKTPESTPKPTSTATASPPKVSVPATPVPAVTTPTPAATIPAPIIDPFIADWREFSRSYLNPCGTSRNHCTLGYTFVFDVDFVDKSGADEPVIITDCGGSESYATNGYRDSNPPGYQYVVTGTQTGTSQCRYSFTPTYDGFYSVHVYATTSSNTPEKTKLFLNTAQFYID